MSDCNHQFEEVKYKEDASASKHIIYDRCVVCGTIFFKNAHFDDGSYVDSPAINKYEYDIGHKDYYWE